MVLSVSSVVGQGMAKPSIPQFSVKITDISYDMPSFATTTVDPFTGEETVTTHPKYHEDRTLTEVSIRNQPFTRYIDAYGKEYRLYYYVEFKDHSDENWGQFRPPVFQSDWAYTIISDSLWGSLALVGSNVDFRVVARIGYCVPYVVGAHEKSFQFYPGIEGSSVGGGAGGLADCVEVVSSYWSDVLTVKAIVASPLSSQTSSLSSSSATSDNSQPYVSDQSPENVFANPFFWGVLVYFWGVWL